MIHCVVVVYNTACANSITCNCLLHQKDGSFDVLVVDNSEKEYGNRNFCADHDWAYYGEGKNLGLSKAYNMAIDYFREDRKSGYICIFDDDTELPPDFFEKFRIQMEEHPKIDVFVPVLTQSNKIISPCRKCVWNRYFRSADECMKIKSAESIQAFNSGMIIRLSLFDSYRYDERIFLDGVDHAFMRDIAELRAKVHVVPVQCKQRFSGREKVPVGQAIRRFEVYIRDSKVLYEKTPIQYWFIVGKRMVHLSMIYKTLRFAKILFK